MKVVSISQHVENGAFASVDNLEPVCHESKQLLLVTTRKIREGPSVGLQEQASNHLKLQW